MNQVLGKLVQNLNHPYAIASYGLLIATYSTYKIFKNFMRDGICEKIAHKIFGGFSSTCSECRIYHKSNHSYRVFPPNNDDFIKKLDEKNGEKKEGDEL